MVSSFRFRGVMVLFTAMAIGVVARGVDLPDLTYPAVEPDRQNLDETSLWISRSGIL